VLKSLAMATSPEVADYFLSQLKMATVPNFPEKIPRFR
jgi:hypothetical protein